MAERFSVSLKQSHLCILNNTHKNGLLNDVIIDFYIGLIKEAYSDESFTRTVLHNSYYSYDLISKKSGVKSFKLSTVYRIPFTYLDQLQE